MLTISLGNAFISLPNLETQFHIIFNSTNYRSSTLKL